MKLSKQELLILEQLANGYKKVSEISKNLKKSNKQIYVTLKKLISKELLELNKGVIKSKKLNHLSLLLQILSKTPNLPEVLAGPGILILQNMLYPKTAKDIINHSGFKRSTVFKKIKQARTRSILKKEKKYYEINEKLWSELKNFLLELKKYEEVIDNRIPIESIIYYKNDKEIIFSNKSTFKATLTAFSTFEKFNIKLRPTTNYYYLPLKKLTKKEIFLHSIYIAEFNKSINDLIFIALFYLKFKKELKISHNIINNLKLILSGEKIKDYPSLKEIKEKAKIYDIGV